MNLLENNNIVSKKDSIYKQDHFTYLTSTYDMVIFKSSTRSCAITSSTSYLREFHSRSDTYESYIALSILTYVHEIIEILLIVSLTYSDAILFSMQFIPIKKGEQTHPKVKCVMLPEFIPFLYVRTVLTVRNQIFFIWHTTTYLTTVS